jgi:hypothetical protein
LGCQCFVIKEVVGRLKFNFIGGLDHHQLLYAGFAVLDDLDYLIGELGFGKNKFGPLSPNWWVNSGTVYIGLVGTMAAPSFQQACRQMTYSGRLVLISAIRHL